MLPNISKRQLLTLVIMGLADFCNAICVSLQAPFFPAEAEKKGATATEYGLVFGCFELVVFLISPIYGQYLNCIGPKVLFNAGIFTTGASAICFGLIDRIPEHFPFIFAAFSIRIIEALGNAAFLTASFAIIAKEFPNNVATTFASLETCFGLGLIVGPMVGGFLYAVGGYYLPFVVLGSTLFLVAVMTICILPRHPPVDEDEKDKKLSLMTVLKIPSVQVSALAICATSASIGFISATLEPHIRQFDLSPILLGVTFVINGALYALTAPIYGCLIDRFLNAKAVTLVGTVFIAIGFTLLGPAPFIPCKTTIPFVVIGLVCHGLGIAAVLVSSFTDALKTAVKHGLPDNIDTYGLISGLWTSTFAFGAFIGPSASGALFDSVGFRGSTCFIIGLHVFVAVTIILFMFLSSRGYIKTKKVYTEYTTSLLRETEESNGGVFPKPSENGVNESLLITTNGNAIGIEHCRPCGMANNLLTCNSYNNKQTHWARLESGSLHNISYRNSYGSLEVTPAPHPGVHRDYETIS